MSGKKHPHFGEQVKQLINALVLAQSWTKGRAVEEIARLTNFAEATVYRWGQGRLLPKQETVNILAQMGRHQANLDREWGLRVLKAAHHPEAEQVVIALWGVVEPRHVPNNLPRSEHSIFFGRTAEQKRLLELLAPSHAAHLITIDGIGGVGKTALILEVAQRCLRASQGEEKTTHIPIFDAIVFVSAKQQYLTGYGILLRQQKHRTLGDIFHEVAVVLDRPEITRITPEEQPDRVRNALARQRTLLIVDNLETMTDRQDIVAFLYDLPPSVKVVITTRERALFSPIRLTQLLEEEGMNLIQHEADSKMVSLELEQAGQLYACTGGVPAATIYAIGQLAAGYSLAGVIQRLKQHEGDVARFCFEGSVAPLRGQPAHHLLMAMSMFPKGPLREAIIHAAGLNTDAIAAEEGLAQLQQLSLISQQGNRYQMLPLTREYALAELSAHTDFEKNAREQWVKWYLEFTREHGGQEWQEWHIQFDQLDGEWKNLLAVFDWCAAHERYEDIRLFWMNDRVADFSNIYGYWDDRLLWQEWLIEEGERRGDWPTVVTAKGNKALTLILLGLPHHLEEAHSLLEEAGQHRDQVESEAQSWIASYRALCGLRQNRLEEAMSWVDIDERLTDQAGYTEPKHTRERVSVLYRRAEVYYKTGDYQKARELYMDIVQKGQSIGWQRAVIYAQNWLADIAIVEGRLEEAEELLHTGLTVSERNKDKRRTALYKRSWAYLEHKRAKADEARRWAEEALDGFDRLGMGLEADEMRDFLRGL